MPPPNNSFTRTFPGKNKYMKTLILAHLVSHLEKQLAEVKLEQEAG